jgi:hypothetical protein
VHGDSTTAEQAALTRSFGGRPSGGTVLAGVRIAAVGLWTEGLTERLMTYSGLDQPRAGAERPAEERG